MISLDQQDLNGVAKKHPSSWFSYGRCVHQEFLIGSIRSLPMHDCYFHTKYMDNTITFASWAFAMPMWRFCEAWPYLCTDKSWVIPHNYLRGNTSCNSHIMLTNIFNTIHCKNRIHQKDNIICKNKMDYKRFHLEHGNGR